MNVSDVLLDVLAAHGVQHMFGIPGDAINDVTDALRRQDRIGFIGVRHEETGALAASVQAKLTGRLAACMGTSGPGGIHLLNGLYDARMDHAPVIAITGQVATGVLATEAHHHRASGRDRRAAGLIPTAGQSPSSATGRFPCGRAIW